MSEEITGQSGRGCIEVTEGALQALEKTRGWVKFLGVVSVIGACFAGLFLLIGLVVLATRGVVGIGVVVEAAIFLVVAILFSVFWLRYSKSLKRLSTTEGSLDDALVQAFSSQKKLWTLQGVLLIIALVVVIFAAIVIVVQAGAHALPV